MSERKCLSVQHKPACLISQKMLRAYLIRQEEPKSLGLVAPDVLTHGHADVDSCGADTLHAGHQTADNN